MILLYSNPSLHAEELDYSYGTNFQILRPLALPRNESYLSAGQSSLRSNLSWMNVWSLQDERFLIDGEELLVSGSYRHALSDRLQVGVRFAFISQGGGAFDEQIEDFHDLTNVGQSQRTAYKQNTFSVSYEPYGHIYPFFDKTFGESYYRRLYPRNYPRDRNDESRPFDIDDRLVALSQGRLADTVDIPVGSQERSGPGDPRIFTQYVFWRGPSTLESLHLGLEAKLPVHGGELIGAPGVDLSISLLARQTWNDRIKTYTGAALTYFGEVHYRFFKLPRYQWVWRAGLDYLLNNQSSLFAEYLIFSKPTNGFGELSRAGHQIALGSRMDINQQTRLQLALIENFLNFGVTPDVGLHLSCDYRL